MEGYMSLSFGEDMFFTEDDEGVRILKNPVWMSHRTSQEPVLNQGQIVVFTDYKADVNLGKEDSLKGKDVLMIPTRKKKIYIPLDEGEQIAEHIFSLVRRIKTIQSGRRSRL
jgi:hypothetical protein